MSACTDLSPPPAEQHTSALVRIAVMIASLTLGLLLTGTLPASAAPNTSYKVVVGSSGVRIRSTLDLSSGSNIVGGLFNGQTVTVICTAQGPTVDGPLGKSSLWNKVKPTKGGATGFLNDSFLRTNATTAVAPPCTHSSTRASRSSTRDLHGNLSSDEMLLYCVRNYKLHEPDRYYCETAYKLVLNAEHEAAKKTYEKLLSDKELCEKSSHGRVGGAVVGTLAGAGGGPLGAALGAAGGFLGAADALCVLVDQSLEDVAKEIQATTDRSAPRRPLRR